MSAVKYELKPAYAGHAFPNAVSPKSTYRVGAEQQVYDDHRDIFSEDENQRKAACDKFKAKKYVLCHPGGPLSPPAAPCTRRESSVKRRDKYNKFVLCREFRTMELASKCFETAKLLSKKERKKQDVIQKKHEKAVYYIDERIDQCGRYEQGEKSLSVSRSLFAKH